MSSAGPVDRRAIADARADECSRAGYRALWVNTGLAAGAFGAANLAYVYGEANATALHRAARVPTGPPADAPTPARAGAQCPSSGGRPTCHGGCG
jgi:hypothetical protein